MPVAPLIPVDTITTIILSAMAAVVIGAAAGMALRIAPVIAVAFRGRRASGGTSGRGTVLSGQ